MENSFTEIAVLGRIDIGRIDMRTKIYEVYGCIGDSEIFIGSSDMVQIATVIANNNLGSARYMTVVVYEVVKENDVVIKRDCIQRLEGC